MKNILIVYSSMTGNTEMIAESIADGINEINKQVVIKDVIEVDVSNLSKYDGLLLGAYTWMDGSLPDEFLDFYEDLEDIDLTGKKAAVFGSGDTMYEYFCAAVDILEYRLQKCGAELIQQGLKIELTPSPQEVEECKQFGIEFAKNLEGL